MSGSARHILTLDAIRGLAAFAVLLIHIGYMTGDSKLATFGYLAVDLFFVMSGFVIGRAYEAKLLAGMSWRQFMLLRIARLYPSLLLGILLGVAAWFVVPNDSYRLDWLSAHHLLLLPDLRGGAIFPLNGALWSLFFELAMNAVHALVVRRLTIPRLILFTIAMGAAWAYVASSSGNWGGGWDRASFLAGFARAGWGYGVGILLHRLAPTLRRVPAIVPIALAALLLLWPQSPALTARVALSVFVFFPLIVALAVTTEVPPYGRRVARWLGAISYPLYAIHHPLLMMMISTHIAPRGPAGQALLAVSLLIVATIVESVYDAPVRKRLAAWASSRTQFQSTSKRTS